MCRYCIIHPMKYHPITDTVKLIPVQLSLLSSVEFKHVYPSLEDYLTSIESNGIAAKKDLELLLRFLTNVVSSSLGTQNRFRNEAERFILFCWNEKQCSVTQAGVEEVREYIDWIWSPPKSLIANTTIASRFKSKSKTDIRLANKNWRPFVMRQSKADRKTKALITPEKTAVTKVTQQYSLNQTSLQNSYASLNVFLKELTESEHMMRNPVALVKKSCKYLIKGKVYKPPHRVLLNKTPYPPIANKNHLHTTIAFG